MSDLFTTLRTRMADSNYGRKIFRTIGIFFGSICVGISVAQTGPALLDLQLITETNTQESSFFITGFSVGNVMGCLIIGNIFGRWNKSLMIFFLALGTTTASIILPWCSVYGLMIVMHGIVAMFVSAFNTATMVDLIRTWAPNSRVFIQIHSTCFSVGGVLSPLMIKPFLAPMSAVNKTLVFFNTSTDMPVPDLLGSKETIDIETSVTDNVTVSNDSPKTRVQFAYLITGMWFLVASCFFLTEGLCLMKEKYSKTNQKRRENSDKNLSKGVFITSIICIVLMFFLMLSVHISFASFLLTYATSQLNWTKANGANLTMEYWIGYTAGRFILIFFTKFVSPFKVLFASSCLILLAITGNVYSSLYQYEVGVWICTGMLGLCISSQVPTLMMWTEESIMELTPRIMSICIISITSPGMLIPEVLGYLIQEVSPMWIFYLPLIQCIALMFLMLFVYIWAKRVVQYKSSDHNIGMKETHEAQTD